jgi:ParB family transcriptional regulator, chromosome partitioning protein
MPQLTPKPTTEHKPLDWFKPDERELARHDDPEKIRLLGLDMLANGQLQAVGATEDGRLIFGHGRFLAAISALLKTLETKLFPSSLSDTQFRLIRAAENLQRKDLTGYQKWLLCVDLMSGNAAWQMKDLAEHLHLDPSTVTRLLSPSRCSPAWQEALKAGTVGISDCYAASKLTTPQEQDGLLALKLSGASRDTIEQQGRKTRNGRQPSEEKASRIKCIVPGKAATVQIAGKSSLSLLEMIEVAQEWVKRAKRAAEQGWDCKTLERACKDESKKI